MLVLVVIVLGDVLELEKLLKINFVILSGVIDRNLNSTEIMKIPEKNGID